MVLPDGVREADVLVEDGRIAAIGSGTASTASGSTEIDARGLVVFPGVVDAHVHCNEPGRTEWEGFAAATRGAAMGGTTTLCDMPLNSIPPTIDSASFDAKRAALERSAVIDVALWGGLVDADRSRLAALRDRGVVGVKAFMSDPGVPEYPRLDDATLREALLVCASLGLLAAVHAEDERVTSERAAALRTVERHDPDAWLRSRPVAAELEAVRLACALAKAAGASLHLLHLSSGAAVEAAQAARRDGADVTAETCPHYLLFSADDVRVKGALLKCAPPIRERDERERLWEAVVAAPIDLIASDHSPSSAERKADPDIWRAWGGVAGVQTLLPAMLTAWVHERGLDLASVARLLCAAPARRLGLHPRKGELRVGADADLALVDLDREWTLETSALQTRSGLSAYAGMRFKGAVVRTIVRGTDVFRDGAIVAPPGHGRFVARAAREPSGVGDGGGYRRGA